MNKTSFPRSDIRVLLLEGVSQTAVRNFRSAGYTQIEFHEKSLPEDQLAARVAEAHIVGIRSRSHLTAGMFRNSRRLMAVGCFCIGTNQVALDAAQARGIPVFNAPYSNTRSVAELVLAEAILLMRRIPEKKMECHSGGWAPDWPTDRGRGARRGTSPVTPQPHPGSGPRRRHGAAFSGPRNLPP